MTPLSNEAVKAALLDLPGWSGNERGLDRKLEFGDFRGAMQFMQSCVQGIELRNHHPVWTNKYNVVEIHLDTFDIGHYVTEKDLDLAKYMNSILDEFGQQFGLV